MTGFRFSKAVTTPKFHLLGSLFLVLVLGGTGAIAQRLDGTLRGTVQDPSEAMVPGAKVTVTNDQTGVSQSTTTTSSGTYVFPNLLVGQYTVAVEKDGFQRYVRKDVAVRSNLIADVNAKLAIGAAGETIEVTGGAEVIQLSDSTLAETFSGAEIVNLPVPSVLGANGIFNLASFAPGTTTQSGGVTGAGGSIGG